MSLATLDLDLEVFNGPFDLLLTLVLREEIEKQFEGEGYGAFKEAVGDAVAELLAPVRERYTELRGDDRALEATLQEGAERARAIASGTLAEVRAAMGVGPAL